ncbi:intradiol ring-cleavage dioxygenase [Solitalea longa]|uniref:Intradiol ring-cleavage dioxygenase n=1 Tax=Solitalea longa TaxID=2079460 RepID=A0A2S4ZZB7_9SPHI|nr:intradiol ring-cleavage dioxygenase [Solitalea longa]POY35292.1 intradiol ring-cleavage dioxygenase [Solitalea longa]
MERKDFLKNSISGIIGISAIAPILGACKNGNSSDLDSESSPNGNCSVTDTETDGPYPLYKSRGSAIQRLDITDGKQGVPLNMTITVRNVKTNCEVVNNARVDIWHCDKDGYYSGYTNTSYLGTQDNSNAVFCRGLQYTDEAGQAKFLTVYPGWYQGRPTHIHVQIYVNNSLKLTSQIAFPEDINTVVYKSELYSAHGQNTTKNANDGIIGDSLDNELAKVVANAETGGYDLEHTIYISA